MPSCSRAKAGRAASSMGSGKYLIYISKNVRQRMLWEMPRFPPKAASYYRDATMILVTYRHGLWVSELVALRWDQVDLEAGRIQIVRRKSSDDSVQPLSGVEIRALRRIKREQPAGLRHVFVSERGAQLTTKGFFKMLSRTAISIGMPDVHPHLLRHGTGFKLVNDGVDTARSPRTSGTGK